MPNLPQICAKSRAALHDAGRSFGTTQADNVRGPAGGGNLVVSATTTVSLKPGAEPQGSSPQALPRSAPAPLTAALATLRCWPVSGADLRLKALADLSKITRRAIPRRRPSPTRRTISPMSSRGSGSRPDCPTISSTGTSGAPPPPSLGRLARRMTRSERRPGTSRAMSWQSTWSRSAL